MNPSYARFLELPEDERRAVFAATAERLDTREGYVEKDFWVCLLLNLLFNALPEDHPKLLFKGGTSLSKVYGLIDRFSEDIDVTVDRHDLGFSGDNDPCRTELSRSKRRKLRKKLEKAGAEYIEERLQPVLAAAVKEVTSEFELVADVENRKNPTLIFRYPPLFPGSPMETEAQVKIEGGARSALDPNVQQTITAYIADDLGWEFSVPNLRTITAERTFWDKIMILHKLRCDFDQAGTPPGDGNPASRHYYDVARITDTQTGEQALADLELMQDVRNHAEIMFEEKRLDKATPGSFRLVPAGDLKRVLEQDYSATTLKMMLGDGPPFGEVISNIEALEQRLNSWPRNDLVSIEEESENRRGI